MAVSVVMAAASSVLASPSLLELEPLEPEEPLDPELLELSPPHPPDVQLA